MGCVSKMAEVLPPDYGYVIFTACGSVLVNSWMVVNVVRARKEHEIPYPLLYSIESKEFNCIQRAHQHTLENYPQFLLMLLVGGLQYPRISAGAGVVYLIGRIVFAKCYYTGDPDKLRWAGFSIFSEIVLFGNMVSFACRLLGIWPHHMCGQ